MNWHYALLAERRGPVDEEELQRLAAAGIVTPETLVWREGMAEWRPYGEAFNRPPPVSAPPRVCSQCLQPFPEDQVILVDNAWVCAACKPVAIQKLREGVAISANAEAEAIRRAHISHEASIKSVGILYLLGAALVCLAALVFVAGGVGGAAGPGAFVGGIKLVVMAVFFLLFGALQGAVGLGLRRLRRWTRIAAGILSGIGLLGFPLGTLINGYILYLLFSKKGATVFSAEYQRIIAQTPHVKHRTSVVAWVMLGLVVAVALVLFFVVGVSSP